jgi:hypothetical protein
MVLLRQTSNELRNLDYDKILLEKVQFLSIAFNGDVLFKLSLMFSIVHNLSQMQDMDRKYNGHVWCKLVTTNINFLFGIKLRKVHCSGHLWCVHDDCENFLFFASCNETF